MRAQNTKVRFLFFCLLLVNFTFAIEIELPAIFADGMVLQRGQNVPVWGTTNAGALVRVKFNGQEKSTTANENGAWLISLNPLKASSKSNVLIISVELNGEVSRVEINDVLVGEVWLCGGQSNMYRPFRMLIGEAREPKYEPIAEYLRKEVATANDPLFRQFKVGRAYSIFEELNKGRGDWSKAIPGEVNEFSGTAYFFAKELREKLNVPIAIISVNLGGTRIEPWMPISAFKGNKLLETYYNSEIAEYQKQLKLWDDIAERKKYNKALAAWEKEVKQAKSEGEKLPNKPRKPEHPSKNKQIPATLYNAMIHPLIPFAIKGAIWYQGESNSKNFPEEYGMRLSALIEGWREAWGQGSFYFYCCQLANYREANEEPVGDEDGWAVLSNNQQEILKLPNTGMAVLNDIGEAKDIHPKNKVDVGKRLSLWALKQAYDKKLVYSGPLYKSSKVKGNKVIIKFKHVGSGLMVGKKELMNPTVAVKEPLKRFQICDKLGVWKWAKAKIIAKDQVAVWHEDITDPLEVRYAWSSNPEGANLYNKEGLPASIFKTGNLKKRNK